MDEDMDEGYFKMSDNDPFFLFSGSIISVRDDWSCWIYSASRAILTYLGSYITKSSPCMLFNFLKDVAYSDAPLTSSIATLAPMLEEVKKAA